MADDSMRDRVEENLRTAVRDELVWMGNAMLQIAKLRAGARNIDVTLKVRVGKVQDEIERFLQDSQASLLLLGAPRGTTTTVFGDDAIEKFAQTIQDDTGITVELIRPEEVEYLTRRARPTS